METLEIKAVVPITVHEGACSFSELIKKVFVDKTLLIKEIVKCHNETILITCPRRFGKSLNMNMLRDFFALNSDENGTKIENYFTESIFKNLKIAKECDSTFITNYFQAYPVIFVNFKDVKANTFSGAFEAVKHAIGDSFRQHGYMINVFGAIKTGHNLTAFEKATADENAAMFFSMWSNKSNVSYHSVKNSLRFLSKLLHAHWNKKVFIFVDEYDTAVNYAVNSGKQDLVEKVQILMDGIYSTIFKDNTSLAKGVLTGISGMVGYSARRNWHPGHKPFLQDHNFTKFYGFTEDEADQLRYY